MRRNFESGNLKNAFERHTISHEIHVFCCDFLNNFAAHCTVGCKIIQALEIIRVKKLIFNAVL